MKLLESVRDARMRRRVGRMSEGQMTAWYETTINTENAAWKIFTQTRSPKALDEVEGNLKAKVALVEGLRHTLSEKFRL